MFFYLLFVGYNFSRYKSTLDHFEPLNGLIDFLIRHNFRPISLRYIHIWILRLYFNLRGRYKSLSLKLRIQFRPFFLLIVLNCFYFFSFPFIFYSRCTLFRDFVIFWTKFQCLFYLCRILSLIWWWFAYLFRLTLNL